MTRTTVKMQQITGIFTAVDGDTRNLKIDTTELYRNFCLFDTFILFGHFPVLSFFLLIFYLSLVLR